MVCSVCDNEFVGSGGDVPDGVCDDCGYEMVADSSPLPVHIAELFGAVIVDIRSKQKEGV